MKFLKTSYNYLLILALVFVVISLFHLGEKFDINYHDAYYYFPMNYLIWAWALILLIYWAIYKLTRKLLWSKYLTLFHVITTILLFIFLYFITFHNLLAASIDISLTAAGTQIDIARYIHNVLFGIFLISQICFVVNVIAGLIKRMRAKSSS